MPQRNHPRKKRAARLLVFWLVMAAGFSILQATVPAQGVPASHDVHRAQGSTYVPLDSWVYDAFDRLHALGYADTAYLGLRPWTRSSCRHVLQQTGVRLEKASDAQEARRISAALNQDSAEDATAQAAVDAVYGRLLGIAGEPLTDSAHFGQTLINDLRPPIRARCEYRRRGNRSRAERAIYPATARGVPTCSPGLLPLRPRRSMPSLLPIRSLCSQRQERPPTPSVS